MKNLIYVAIVGGLIGVSTSCNSSDSANSDSTNSKHTEGIQTKEQRLAEIAEIEEQVKRSKGKNSKSHAERLDVHLEAFATDFRSDSLAPEMLFKAGNVCIGLENYKRAIAHFNRVVENYPDYMKRPEVIYMTGFVYDYYLSQYGKAKEYYQEVINEYPNHIFAEDAANAIDVLGMSDEELIERFKQNNTKKEES